MKIKMKMSVAGTFHNIEAGVKVGQVVDIEDAEAIRYIALGYAEAVQSKSVEHAVVPPSNEERAVLSTEIVGASSKPIPQPKAPRPPKVESIVEKSEPKAVVKTPDVVKPPAKPAPGRPARKPRQAS